MRQSKRYINRDGPAPTVVNLPCVTVASMTTIPTIISIEKGRFDPSLPLVFRIARTFGCAIEEIFFPDDDA